MQHTFMSEIAGRQNDHSLEEHRREESRRRQLVKAQWPILWRALCDAVIDQVEAFNAQHPDASTHLQAESRCDDGFMVRRNARSVVNVVGAFVRPAHAVQLAWVTMAYDRVGRSTRHLELPFAVDELGMVGVVIRGKLKTPAEAAEWLLRPLA